MAGDLLSQWCAYADDGAGFAIGFSTAGMEERCNRDARGHDLGLSLEPVVYDPAEHERLLAAELIKLCDKGRRPGRIGRRRYVYLWANQRCQEPLFKKGEAYSRHRRVV